MKVAVLVRLTPATFEAAVVTRATMVTANLTGTAEVLSNTAGRVRVAVEALKVTPGWKGLGWRQGAGRWGITCR